MEESGITRLLERWGAGEREALDELMPLVYSELKRTATAYLERERPGATLQVTLLVHEAYLRLVGYQRPNFESRKHFYAVAAQLMRRIWSITLVSVTPPNAIPAGRDRRSFNWFCNRMSTFWIWMTHWTGSRPSIPKRPALWTCVTSPV
jgi:hypothetical protein